MIDAKRWRGRWARVFVDGELIKRRPDLVQQIFFTVLPIKADWRPDRDGVEYLVSAPYLPAPELYGDAVRLYPSFTGDRFVGLVPQPPDYTVQLERPAP